MLKLHTHERTYMPNAHSYICGSCTHKNAHMLNVHDYTRGYQPVGLKVLSRSPLRPQRRQATTSTMPIWSFARSWVLAGCCSGHSAGPIPKWPLLSDALETLGSCKDAPTFLASLYEGTVVNLEALSERGSHNSTRVRDLAAKSML